MEQKFYRCAKCGKIIAVVEDRPTPTICCGEPMAQIIPNTSDGAGEKHIPVYQVEGNLVRVVVGEVIHPMLENHYIQWISIQTNKGNQRKVLKPGEEPKAEFLLLPGEKLEAVYEYCNLHSLFKA